MTRWQDKDWNILSVILQQLPLLLQNKTLLSCIDPDGIERLSVRLYRMVRIFPSTSRCSSFLGCSLYNQTELSMIEKSNHCGFLVVFVLVVIALFEEVYGSKIDCVEKIHQCIYSMTAHQHKDFNELTLLALSLLQYLQTTLDLLCLAKQIDTFAHHDGTQCAKVNIFKVICCLEISIKKVKLISVKYFIHLYTVPYKLY